jgi:hypothetical protein
MITFPLAQPTIMMQFLIILGSFYHRNSPLNIDLPTTFILLISYNIIFGPSHLHKIDFRVYMPHKNQITSKQITKRHVCSSAQRRAHASKATIWTDDKIFRVNIYNNRNGCTFIINFPIARRPKAFQYNITLPWDRS